MNRHPVACSGQWSLDLLHHQWLTTDSLIRVLLGRVHLVLLYHPCHRHVLVHHHHLDGPLVKALLLASCYSLLETALHRALAFLLEEDDPAALDYVVADPATATLPLVLGQTGLDASAR